jgi:hypothetical protein
VLLGFKDTKAAARDAAACAKAVGSGNRSAAKRDARQEQRKINQAISALESGGKLLKLF